MKKWIVTVALASSAFAASAQSNATVFGIVDLTLARGAGSISDKHQLTNSGLDSSRIGFRGTEDLGGGVSAAYWLEAAVNPDSGIGGRTNTNNQASGAVPAGGLIFNRRSTVGFVGNWGEVRIGRDYNPQYRNISAFDPFWHGGVGATLTGDLIITGVTSIRASNSITYLYNTSASGWAPRGNGIYGSVMYYLGENSSDSANHKDGTGGAIRLGYKAGPLDIALALGKTDYDTVGGSGVAGLVGAVHQNNIGGTYDFGAVKVYGQYTWDKNGTLEGRGHLIGATIPFGANYVATAYSHYRTNAATDPAASKFALGYVHSLSKRTALYGTAAYLKNENSSAASLNGSVTAPGHSSNGIDLGLRHSF